MRQYADRIDGRSADGQTRPAINPHDRKCDVTLTVGSLFAGIGGFDLGFEMAGGFEIVWQCEIDDWCRRVLKKHWPNVRQHDNIKTFPTEKHDWSCDIICGGFPCQDLPYAGTGAGLDGGRSNLWFEMLRVVRVVRPRYVAVENVPALLGRGMGTVVSGLAEIGYVVEWDCVSASAVGAPHRRNRIWIVAHADEPNSCNPGTLADAEIQSVGTGLCTNGQGAFGKRRPGDGGCETKLADTARQRMEGDRAIGQQESPLSSGPEIPGRDSAGRGTGDGNIKSGLGGMVDGVPVELDRHWETEPADTPRVATGVKDRKNRLRGLGNAIVPQVAANIATLIRNHHETTNASRD